MTADELAAKSAEFRDWVKRFRGLWSHIHVAALALRLDNKWVAIRSTAVLADAEKGSDPWGAPIVDEPSIMAVRAAVPIKDLDRLLDAALDGQLKAGTVPGLDRNLFLSLPFGEPPANANFQVYLNPHDGATPRNYARAEFNVQGKSPSDSLSEPWKHFAVIEAADRRLVRLAHGSGGVLGSRLGLWANGSSLVHNQWNTSVTSEFIAPLPVRLVQVDHVREKDIVRANVELGPLVHREDVTITLRPAKQDAWFPPRKIRSKKRLISVEVARRVPAGDALVSLCLDPLGEVLTRSVTIDPPLSARPYAIALGELDPDHRLLKQGLGGSDAYEFERAIAILLALLGYSPSWWGPEMKKLPRPGDLQPGAAPDVLAYHEALRDLLLLECTTGFVGSDKVNKLVGRSLRIQNSVRTAVGAQSPRVRAVLAIGIPSGEVAPGAKAALEQNGAGLLGRDDAQQLCELVIAGATAEEARARFETIFPDSMWRPL